MANEIKTGDKFTNRKGTEVLTVLDILPSGRFYYSLDWKNGERSKYATGAAWVAKNYPNKVEA